MSESRGEVGAAVFSKWRRNMICIKVWWGIRLERSEGSS